MIEIETLVGSYAFPIVMCLWFMHRTEKIITKNTEATDNLGHIITVYFNNKDNGGK
jgi:hypothetical protein